MSEISGIVKVDKPEGWTSFDVVNKIRGTLQRESGKKLKVGHSGTLDPFATGLLVVAYGSCTKKLDGLLKLPKSYTAVLRFGAQSSTGDKEGEIEEKTDTNEPSIEDVESILHKFLGKSLQTPPAYSAIKIGGKKSYELARKGQNVEHKPREIEISDLNLIDYKYPSLEFECSVSSGTYIRVLAEDIAATLGTNAYLTELRRSEIGSYDLSNTVKPTASYEDILAKSTHCTP